MSIFRIHKQRNFTTIDNRLINDVRLTWEAKGLLIYLLSKPDGWQVNVGHLCKQSPTRARSSIYRLFRQLRGLGYMTAIIRRKSGRYAGTDWEVYEIPGEKIVDSDPDPDPDTGGPDPDPGVAEDLTESDLDNCYDAKVEEKSVEYQELPPQILNTGAVSAHVSKTEHSKTDFTKRDSLVSGDDLCSTASLSSDECVEVTYSCKSKTRVEKARARGVGGVQGGTRGDALGNDEKTGISVQNPAHGPAHGPDTQNEVRRDIPSDIPASRPTCASLFVPLLSESERTFIAIPTRDGINPYAISQFMIEDWEAEFPGLNVKKELRKIRQWNLDNPEKRKKIQGMRKHIAGWLRHEFKKVQSGDRSGNLSGESGESGDSGDPGDSGDSCDSGGSWESWGRGWAGEDISLQRIEREIMALRRRT